MTKQAKTFNDIAKEHYAVANKPVLPEGTFHAVSLRIVVRGELADDTKVTVKHSGCGNSFIATLGEILKSETLQCPSCGVVSIADCVITASTLKSLGVEPKATVGRMTPSPARTARSFQQIGKDYYRESAERENQ